jgi:hypothetical protein
MQEWLSLSLSTPLARAAVCAQDLVVEGTDELTAAELQAACEARGMQAIGLTPDAMRAQLDEWLQLSVTQKVPMTLLLLSRSFVIAQPRGSAGAGTAKALQESISAIDSNVVNEVVLAQRPASGERTAAEMERRLESLEFQNELIEAEREATVRRRGGEGGGNCILAGCARHAHPPPPPPPACHRCAGIGCSLRGRHRRGGAECSGGRQRGGGSGGARERISRCSPPAGARHRRSAEGARSRRSGDRQA